VLDAGAGTGRLLATLLDAAPERRGVALDISKHAMRFAARAHPHIGAVVADVWAALPLRAGSVALVVSVFSPRNAEEFARVLAPEGALLVATPAPSHLQELIGPLGLLDVDPRKDERLAAKLEPNFVPDQRVTVEFTLELTREAAFAAAEMGPSAAHVSAEELAARAGSLGELTPVTVAVNVSLWRPRSAHRRRS
jgi:23S rRNA (guanine745-N1)-methyltransferase